MSEGNRIQTTDTPYDLVADASRKAEHLFSGELREIETDDHLPESSTLLASDCIPVAKILGDMPDAEKYSSSVLKLTYLAKN